MLNALSRHLMHEDSYSVKLLPEEEPVDWTHVTADSHAALRSLREQARRSGDETFQVLLSGLDLYIALGREYELIELMRHFAEAVRESVENTPSSADLERLYRQEGPIDGR
jgi:hypothetical protein